MHWSVRLRFVCHRMMMKDIDGTMLPHFPSSLFLFLFAFGFLALLSAHSLLSTITNAYHMHRHTRQSLSIVGKRSSVARVMCAVETKRYFCTIHQLLLTHEWHVSLGKPLILLNTSHPSYFYFPLFCHAISLTDSSIFLSVFRAVLFQIEILTQQLHERRVEYDELHAEQEALHARLAKLTKEVRRVDGLEEGKTKV